MSVADPQVMTIFCQALEHRAPQERAAYLDQACGPDAGLRARIEALLQAHGQAGDFLSGSSSASSLSAATDQRPAGEGLGSRIGPYKLLQQIGEGGMGVVFMAEQTNPVQRKVALKLIKSGMDNSQVLARFEAERQALALMDHPNIARVLDAGTTESGRPYFVMELVKGVPITRYCDEHQSTPQERLELFVPVCQAVQHAHQKGIIHRDLKPSNVSVCLYDDKPVPKVIDFGVAKATGPKLTERTLFTELGQVVGTLQYMSPEQAKLNQLDIDTRSDIYSLGVLLYELLTGTTPLEPQRFQATAFLEVLRLIREEEPPRPSTRLSTAQGLPAIATNRGLEPSKLSGLLRGELDWIVMKALEKDRNQRYDTPHALALDIQRYLHDETVLACPPTARYRLRKLARRHKAGLATALGVVLAMLCAVLGLAFSNLRIHEEQKRTEQAQRLAEERAEQIGQDLDHLQAADSLLERGRWHVHVTFWDDAHAAFTRAIRLRPDHAWGWVERADLYTRLGLWDLAAADYAREFEVREPAMAFHWYQHTLLRLHVGDTDGYRRACRWMRPRFGGTTTKQFAVDLMRAYVLSPDTEGDAAWLVEVSQNIVADSPATWLHLYVLGIAHYRAGQYEQAVRRLRESIVVQPDLASRALSHPVLAMAYRRVGQAVEARRQLDETARALDQWTQQGYDSRAGQSWVTHQGAAGWWPVSWWDWFECWLFYREAKVLIDGAPPPDDARLHVLRARGLAGLRWNNKADDEYAEALKLRPEDPAIRREAHRNRGYCRIGLGRWDAAAADFARASELQPEDVYLWRFQAVAHLGAEDLGAYRQTCAAMVKRFEKTADQEVAGNVVLACVLRRDALRDTGRLVALAQVAARSYHMGAFVLGAALYRAGRYDEAIRCFEAAAKVYRPRAWDWAFLAMAHSRRGQAAEARRCLAEATRWIAAADRGEDEDLTGTRPAWGGWWERVVYPLLLQEAEALVGANETNT